MAQTPTEQQAAPSRRRPPKWAFDFLINPVLRTLLRSPLHSPLSKRLMLVSFPGRKSGKRYTVIVGYSRADSLLLTSSESRWARNLKGGVPVQVRLRGQHRSGTADTVTGVEGLTEHFRQVLRIDPAVARIIGVSLGPDGEPLREDVLRSVQEGWTGIRIRLD